MKKLLFTLLLALSIFTLASCHSSSYKALALVRINTGETFETSFSSLEGKLVQKIAKKTDSSEELSFEGTISSGEVTVSYEIDGEVKVLFTLKSGESIKDKVTGIKKGTKVYIIIETKGEVKSGNFTFSLK